ESPDRPESLSCCFVSDVVSAVPPARVRLATTIAAVDLGLHGKAAIVTGGSQGIGLSIAVALAAEGADLVLVARRADRLDTACAAVDKLGGRAVTVAADVSTPAGVAAVIAATAEAFGGADILVNNAGKGHMK